MLTTSSRYILQFDLSLTNKLKECNAFPCDTGSSREVLESSDEFKDFNFEMLTPDWTSKKGFYGMYLSEKRSYR